MYRIEVERSAQKELARLPHEVRRRVIDKIEALAMDPRPSGCRPVEDAPRGTYRVWVGRYRLVYLVLDDDQVLVVARVAKRDESTYRGL